MAKSEKFIIAIVGTAGNADQPFQLEKILKKFFSPSEFEIRIPALDVAKLDDVELRVFQAKAAKTFQITLNGFQRLEVQVLAALGDESVHCAIALDTVKSGIAWGQFEWRALLVEAIGQRSWDATKNNLHSFVSTFSMPFFMPSGIAHGVVTRGESIVTRGVIDGWKTRSPGYDGILRKMKLG